MPGLFGFTKNNQTASIKTMQEAMTLYPHFKHDDLFEDNLISASRVHLNKIGEKSSPTKKNGIFIWIEGEAYNLPELSNDFKYNNNADFSSALLVAYENNQLDDFLNKLDGYFCAVIYDQNKKQIKLISDRYGMRMLYWYYSEGQFSWASEVKGILALDNIDKIIDPTSFNCFMDLGYLLGEHTWFEKIKLIKPATILSFDLLKQEIHQHHYWTWAEIKPSSLNFDEAVDELGKRFIKAVERRFNPNEKIGISLSGGLDSRAIFAAVHHLYPEYTGYAYTFGIPNCDDITIAKRVAKLTNWNYKEYHFDNTNWFKPRLEKIWNTDGMQDMMHMHGGEFLNDIANNIDVNLNGYGGGLLTGEWINKDLLNSRITNNDLLKIFNKYAVIKSSEESFYCIDHIEPYIYMNRNRRYTNMGTVNSLIAIEQRKPILDNHVVELLMSLPDEYRLNNKLYSAMLHKFFPIFFKDIPWQKTGKPAGLVIPKSIPVRAFNKILRHLKALIGIKSSTNYTDYNSWIRSPEVSDFLKELLRSETARYTELTNLNLFEKYLLPHLTQKRSDMSTQILRAVTIEIYLRKLIKEDLPN